MFFFPGPCPQKPTAQTGEFGGAFLLCFMHWPRAEASRTFLKYAHCAGPFLKAHVSGPVPSGTLKGCTALKSGKDLPHDGSPTLWKKWVWCCGTSKSWGHLFWNANFPRPNCSTKWVCWAFHDTTCNWSTVTNSIANQKLHRFRQQLRPGASTSKAWERWRRTVVVPPFCSQHTLAQAEDWHHERWGKNVQRRHKIWRHNHWNINVSYASQSQNCNPDVCM